MTKLYNADIWDFHAHGFPIAITTNGVTDMHGYAIMGGGIALEAKTRFPTLPSELGDALVWNAANLPFIFKQYNLVTFPTKHHWREQSSLSLIENSCKILVELNIFERNFRSPLYIPAPGCGRGGLTFDIVEPILQHYLDDNYVVIIK